jgi:hypothetical protein
MTPEELYSDAINARAQGSVIGMTLVFPRGFKRPPGFPRGELLCENSNGQNVYRFSPEKIIKWIEKNNLAVQP